MLLKILIIKSLLYNKNYYNYIYNQKEIKINYRYIQINGKYKYNISTIIKLIIFISFILI